MVGRLVGETVGRDVGGGVNLALGEVEGDTLTLGLVLGAKDARTVGVLEGIRLKLGELLGDNDARMLGVKDGERLMTTVGEAEGPVLILGLMLGVILPDGAIGITVPSSLAISKGIPLSMDVSVIVELSSKVNILVCIIPTTERSFNGKVLPTRNVFSGGVISTVALKAVKSTTCNPIVTLVSLLPT